MKTREIIELSERCRAQLDRGRDAEAYATLAPVLAARTPFTLLDRLGQQLSLSPRIDPLLDRIATRPTIGGWPVIGSALQQRLATDLTGALDRCREFIVIGNVWHSTDSLGERVLGSALANHFAPALNHLKSWRVDESHWVRRSLGVGVHVWAKRARGADEHAVRARKLLAFLAPLFGERHIEAVKGVGWGLKTLGRYYSELTTEWLTRQVNRGGCSALMLRKATTYLSASQRQQVYLATFR